MKDKQQETESGSPTRGKGPRDWGWGRRGDEKCTNSPQGVYSLCTAHALIKNERKEGALGTILKVPTQKE